MKSDDELRERVDGAKAYRPQRTDRAGRPVRDLAATWAGDIALSFEAGGVVEGLMPRTGLTVLYGESNTGKTFAAIDLACHVAAGLPWRGMDVERGVVIYVAAEAPESVKRRVWAWRQHHQVDHLPVLIVESSIDLLNGDTDAMVALVARVARDHGRVAMVVFDTLARSMTGNENSPEDMGKFVAACGAIREAGETHVLVVHHSGKDTAKGARGHSSLRAATDVELEVASGVIRVTKNRDEARATAFGFKLEVVELGVNAKGRTVKTCVAVEAEAPTKPAPRAAPLTPTQHGALSSLSTALSDHGEAPPPSHDIPAEVKVVRIEHWLEAAERYMPSLAGHPPWRQRFNLQRIADALRAKGAIRFAGGFYWLPSQASPTSQPSHILSKASQ